MATRLVFVSLWLAVLFELSAICFRYGFRLLCCFEGGVAYRPSAVAFRTGFYGPQFYGAVVGLAAAASSSRSCSSGCCFDICRRFGGGEIVCLDNYLDCY